MSRAQLPLVDPDFRLVERQAGNLHAYARGLLTESTPMEFSVHTALKAPNIVQ